jgi:hypothetical protein
LGTAEREGHANAERAEGISEHQRAVTRTKRALRR